MKVNAPMKQDIFNPELIRGLSVDDVNVRRSRDGYNELPSQKEKTLFVIIFEVLREPMLLLLLGCGFLYLLLGEAQDAMMLLTFVVVVIAITLYEKRKTEHAIEALKNLSSPRALVVRDGTQKRIAGREVVLDDILVLREGDRVPADAVMLQTTNLSIDESLLTGESMSVRKRNWDYTETLTHPGGEDLPFVFSGTVVTQGHGIAKVVAVGVKTEMGKIGKSLSDIEEEETLLRKETDKMVRNFALTGFILCTIVFVVFGITYHNWIGGLLTGLTLAMAMLPEEFGVVLIVFFTLGAWRISKRKVLTRKTSAIETLGATTVLCVDKTGTVTMNRMKLHGILVKDRYLELVDNNQKLPDEYHELFEYGYLASQKDPFDPLEIEIKTKLLEYLSRTEHIHENWKLIQEYPLSKELLALSHVWQSPDKKQYVIAAKGAPEAIGDLCHLSPADQKKLTTQITEMSKKGLRILGVAKAVFADPSLPSNQHDFVFHFVGLLGFVDPVRPNVLQSVKECYSAGIRIIMITGDYPGTAQHVAKSIGLANPEKYITGPELSGMSVSELREKIRDTNIFARVVPEQKLAIVNALKANGEVVTMTGDGVNDAPALKAAHIGVAMGENGTDVARESADFVLLNDDFSSIVSAVRLGRRIYDNLQKAIAFIFSVHVPIAGLALFPVLFHLPIILFPAHIAFLELIIDPSCTVVFESENEEFDIMDRPPRKLTDPLFSIKKLLLSLLQGFSSLFVVIAVFVITLKRGAGEVDARTLAYVAIVISNLLLIIVNLSRRDSLFRILRKGNKALFGVLGATGICLFLILSLPFLRSFFHFSELSLTDIAICIALSCFGLLWYEIFKLARRHHLISF